MAPTLAGLSSHWPPPRGKKFIVQAAAFSALFALAGCSGGVLDPKGPIGAANSPLAFGVLIVVLVVAGSLWIMYNLNHNMMPMDQMLHMQR